MHPRVSASSPWIFKSLTLIPCHGGSFLPHVRFDVRKSSYVDVFGKQTNHFKTCVRYVRPTQNSSQQIIFTNHTFSIATMTPSHVSWWPITAHHTWKKTFRNSTHSICAKVETCANVIVFDFNSGFWKSLLKENFHMWHRVCWV